MRKILQRTIGWLAVYFIAWTAAFAGMFFSRGETSPWDLYWSYFTMAWTFRAGELPSFIWLFSIVLFVPLAALVVFASRMHGRSFEDHAFDILLQGTCRFCIKDAWEREGMTPDHVLWRTRFGVVVGNRGVLQARETLI